MQSDSASVRQTWERGRGIKTIRGHIAFRCRKCLLHAVECVLSELDSIPAAQNRFCVNFWVATNGDSLRRPYIMSPHLDDKESHKGI
ncbi:hypothetical protein AVEN_251048-1 [Araneus ventricosus]|uniref:Uncharacterized protein n=1 Tax=Araneus ventricosus TaxID=182803 RepID=A0A4Y2DM99_ARAVE|nr:hypothetical protein AVEN_251048-1 [Araneus ventricosus]